MRKLRTGDNVQIIAGDERGKKGKIMRLVVKGKDSRAKGTPTHAIVEGVNTTQRRKKGLPGQPGRVATVTVPVNISNLAFIDPEKKTPTRVAIKTAKNGTKQRIAIKSNKQI